MPPPDPSLASYLDRLLAVLDRIAIAIEAQNRGHTTTDFPLEARRVPPSTTLLNDSPTESAVLGSAGTPGIPYDTVRAAVMAYQDAKGAHAAQSVLKEFGAKYITELKADPSRYQAVLDALK
jgi:hypothetical protein